MIDIKEFEAVFDLHQAYGKHVEGRTLGYNAARCKVCGMPFDRQSGITTASACSGLTKNWRKTAQRYYRHFPEHIASKMVDVCVAEGTVPVFLIHAGLAKLVGKKDLTRFREILLKAELQPYELENLLAYAVYFDKEPKQDVLDVILKTIRGAKERGLSSRMNSLDVLMGWYKMFNISPSYQIYKEFSAAFINKVDRAKWARLYKGEKHVRASFRWSTPKESLHAYYLTRDLDNKRFKNAELMKQDFGHSYVASMLYYRDTGNLILNPEYLSNDAAAIKTKLIDRVKNPSKEELKAMGKRNAKYLYGSRSDRLEVIGECNSAILFIAECKDLDEYLKHEWGFAVSELGSVDMDLSPMGF